MNVRRINAAKNFGNISKAMIILLCMVFLVFMSIVSNNIQGDKEKNVLKIRFWMHDEVTNISLSDFSCQQIYDGIMNQTLYKNTKNESFDSSEIILYYLRNCNK
jgi:hypothetical protein